MRGSALLAIVIAATTPLLILTVVAVATGFRLVAWQPPVLWQHSLGVGGVTAIASDSSGVYVEGYNHWQLVGPGSVFLKKYDSSGGVVWNRTIGEFNNAMINEMSVGTDSIYLSAGNFSNGIFLKYDLAGNNLWERDYAAGTNPIWGSSFGLSALPEGVYVTGDSSLWTSPTYASSVAWVREYDSAGNAAWTSEFSSDTIISTHVYASSLGVFIAYSAGNTTRYLGSFLAKYSLSGNQLWTRQVPAAGGISGDSTGVYLTGSSIYKYDFNGNLDWVTPINSPDGLLVHDSSVSVNSYGIYVSASTISHLYLLKYDLGGSQIWNIELPSSEGNAHSVSANSSAVYVLGWVSSNVAIVERLSPDASLIFFGLNPPWSFMLLGGLIGASAICIITFQRLRRKTVRPLRVGPSQHTLPTTD